MRNVFQTPDQVRWVAASVDPVPARVLAGIALAASLLVSACGGGQAEAEAAGANSLAGKRRALAASVAVGALVVNEVNTANWRGATDEDGDAKDWVELHNPGAQTIDLNGFGLSNKPKSPFRWVFPNGATIQPGQYLRVWLSQKDRAVANAPLHTSFNLDNGADPIILTAPDGTAAGLTLDSTTAPLMKADTSWCRQPGAGAAGAFVHCATPTPGAANAGASDAALLATPTMSVASGFYGAAQTVAISGPAGAQIRYTRDGSEPTAASPLYASPLSVAQSTVLRAAAFASGRFSSFVDSQTYVVGADEVAKYAGQRVVFVSMSPSDFAAFQAKDKTLVSRVAVEMFAANGTRLFKAPAEADVAGQLGSLLYPQVGMDISFRDALGVKSVTKTSLWPEKSAVTTVKKFRLRNGGNDWPLTHLRDQFAQSLNSESGNLYSSSVSASLVINGAYYGLVDLREKEEEALVESNLGVNGDSVDFISDPLLGAQDIKNGGAAAVANYRAMHDFVSGNSMAVAANYQKAKTLLNVDSFAQDWALHAATVQTDWVQGNVHVWRTPEVDGRWNWQPHDFDFAFGLVDQDTPATNMYRFVDVPNSDLIRALLKNAEFRQRFINTVADQLNSVMTPAHARARFETMVAEMRPYRALFESRYGNDIAGPWEPFLARVRSFIDARGDLHDAHTRAYFGLSPRRNVDISVNDVTMGTVKVNTLDLTRWITASGTAWTGRYYPEVPVTLEARPKPGYRFVAWQGANTSSARTLTHTPAADASFTAVFEKITAAAPVIGATPAQSSLTGDLVNVLVPASDPNQSGYVLKYSATGLPNGVAMNAANGRIYGKVTTPGAFTVVVTVSNGAAAATSSFSWVVSDRPSPVVPPTNQPPTLAVPGAQSSSVAAAVSLQLAGSDPEGGALTYAATGLPTGLNIATTSGLISGTPTAAGSFNVTVTVADSAGARVSAGFTWVVAPVAVNQAPVFTVAPANQSAVLGQSVTVISQAKDPEGGALSYVATGLPGGLTLASATGVMSGTLTTTGSFAVTVTARDSQDAIATARFTWLVSAPVNLPPTVTAIANQSSTVGQAVMLALLAKDPEGGALSYAATGLPPGLNIGATSGLIAGTVSTAGSFPALLTVRDGQGGSNSVRFTWTVAAAGNRPPLVIAVPAQFHRVGTAVGVWINAQDPEGKGLSFSAQGLPAGLSISSKGFISGVASSAGSFATQVTVKDPAGAQTQVTVQWNMLAAVRNGSFELPALKGTRSSLSSVATDWVLGNKAVVLGFDNASAAGVPATSGGKQMLALPGGATAAQTITLSPGDSVRLRAAQSASWSLGAQSLGVYVNGVKQGAVAPANRSWAVYTVPLNISARGTYKLELRGLATGLLGVGPAFVDLVEVFQAAVTEMPNGGFELPQLAAGEYRYGPAAAAWTFTGAAGVSAGRSGFTTSLPSFPEGSQVAFLQDAGTLAQTVRLKPGDLLRLRATQRLNFGTGPQTVAVFVNGVQKSKVLTPTSGAWSSFEVPLNVSKDGDFSVEIRGLTTTPGQDRTAFVDAVQLLR